MMLTVFIYLSDPIVSYRVSGIIHPIPMGCLRRRKSRRRTDQSIGTAQPQYTTYIPVDGIEMISCPLNILEQKKQHQGINGVKIVTAKTDSVTNVTNVFLTLCFGDSVNEEIVVPMIEKNGVWKMK